MWLYTIVSRVTRYCRTHNVSVCLCIAYIACGSASLYIKTLYFFLTVLALSAAATVANIKIRYDAKTPQFPIFGTRVICVFYSICLMFCHFDSHPFVRFRLHSHNTFTTQERKSFSSLYWKKCKCLKLQ